MTKDINCYDVPQYWDLAFSEDTLLEADFLEAVVQKYCRFALKTLYEPGCGGGRLIHELAKRGFDVTGVDQSSAAVEFANRRLSDDGLAASVSVGDMRDAVLRGSVDVAYCLVNTFRHLLREADAVRHLQNVAAMLRPEGLYVVGMHLLPPDADEVDDEEWSVHAENLKIHMRLDVTDCDRSVRQETLSFEMTVENLKSSSLQTFQSDYRMRLYEASDMLSLLNKVPQLELLDVYDFWYDISEPLTLSDEMADTVFVMQKTDVKCRDPEMRDER